MAGRASAADRARRARRGDNRGMRGLLRGAWVRMWGKYRTSPSLELGREGGVKIELQCGYNLRGPVEMGGGHWAALGWGGGEVQSAE